MKMILGILNNDDAPLAIQHLTKDGFFVTKLSTSGGFLRAGNVTILVGVEDERSSPSSTSSISTPTAGCSSCPPCPRPASPFSPPCR